MAGLHQNSSRRCGLKPGLNAPGAPSGPSTARGRAMDRLNQDKAAKVGDVLFRYMRARHRFKEKIEHPLAAHELAALIGSGKT